MVIDREKYLSNLKCCAEDKYCSQSKLTAARKSPKITCIWKRASWRDSYDEEVKFHDKEAILIRVHL